MPAQAKPCEAPRACKRRQSKVETRYACCASSNQHICFISVVLCVADVQTRLLNAQWCIDARKTYSYPMAVLCTLPAQKCLPVSLTLKNRVFRCSLFSKFFVLQNCAFCSFRSAFYKKLKGFWTLEASPPVPHGGCALLRESPELPALHFALFRCPNILSSFGSWRVGSSATVHFEVHFKRYSLPISL